MNLDRQISQLKPGAQLSVQEWQNLNAALQAQSQRIYKSASVGYPSQAVTATDNFASLVPQSIESVLTSASYSEKHIVMWNMLEKTPVWNTLHEATVTDEYGNEHLPPFIAEGGSGVQNDSSFDRVLVRVKYLAERRELTDVATLVGTVGGAGIAPRGLAIETRNGTKNLMGKLESNLFFGRSDLSTLQFDGFYKQISDANPENVTDKRGETISPQDLVGVIYESFGAPQYSDINYILVEPKLYGSLINIATAFGRHQQPSGGGGERQVLGFNKNVLVLYGPTGEVPIVSVPKMFGPRSPNTVAAGGTTSDALPASFLISRIETDGSIAAAPNASSQFTAEDAGDYHYKVVAVGDSWVTAPITTTTPITVAAGDSVTIEIDDGGDVQAAISNVKYYRVYRSTKDGAATTASWMWEFPANTDGTGSRTQIIDHNAYIPQTTMVWPLSISPEYVYWAKFLDFFRRPLAQVATSVPFLLLLFGALHVKVPRKQFILTNVSPTL